MEALNTQPAATDPAAELITTARDGGSADHAGAIIGHLDIWTSAIQSKSASGRGSGKRFDLYGIKKLRELILELAVRGKLVPQDSNDESASALLERINAEKAQLVKEKKIKRTKAQPAITDIEVSASLPQSWQWVRFGDIAQHNSGKTLDKGRNSGTARPYLTTSNLYWGRFELDSVREMLIKDEELDKCSATKGDLLICEGGDAGRAAVWFNDYDVCFQNHIHRARFFGGINPYYAFRVFEKLNATGEIDQYRKGVGISNMSGKALASIVFPLPPLPEQHNIVAKVDELMDLCDQLEQQTEASIDAHATLVETMLGSLLQPAAAAEGSSTDSAAERTTARDGGSVETAGASFDQNWARIADHFDTLFTTEHSIDQLKQTVLQLAVMGKLVPQDPDDEPACVLLQKIAAEKARLVKEKKIKKPKPLVTFEGLDEMKYPLPDNWIWCRLDDTADIVRGGSPRPAGDPKFYDGAIPFLKVADVTRKSGKFVEGYNATIKEAGLKKTRLIEERTVLLSNSGATLGIPAICDFAATFNDGIAAFVERSEHVFDEYLYLYLANLSKWFLEIASRGQGQPNLNTDIVKATWFALPPEKEQHRIVAKVDQLMTLCDQLKERLQHAQQTQLHLADALVEEALSA